jgi:TDG/mug DNA glycosylase family protein
MDIAIATSILKRPDHFFTRDNSLSFHSPLMNELPDTSAACPFGRLPPVHGESPEVVILGSFPSRQSLLKNEYYGNPRNHFWQVMEALFSLDRHLPYPVRTSRLIDHRIALWDVICTCSREGSADARIRSPVFNDIAGFLASFPSLRLVALNGNSAGRYYHQLNIAASVPAVVLPSTSPANTRYSLDEKIRSWEIIRRRASKKI